GHAGAGPAAAPQAPAAGPEPGRPAAKRRMRGPAQGRAQACGSSSLPRRKPEVGPPLVFRQLPPKMSLVRMHDPRRWLRADQFLDDVRFDNSRLVALSTARA